MFKSKVYQHTETGELTTKIPIMEIGKYKEAIKSIACKHFLFIMDNEEDPSYKKNLDFVVNMFNMNNEQKEKLEKEIDFYI